MLVSILRYTSSLLEVLSYVDNRLLYLGSDGSQSMQILWGMPPDPPRLVCFAYLLRDPATLATPLVIILDQPLAHQIYMHIVT